MTPQERKVMELALEALEGYESCIDAYYAGAVCPQIDKAITAIKEALAQTKQEPATYSAWGLMGGDEFVNKDSLNRNIT